MTRASIAPPGRRHAQPEEAPPRSRVTSSPPWRVEDLAELVDVSVDTIRYYQKLRLLPAPARDGRVAWYDTAHRARLERIRQLQSRGLTLALIQRIVEGGIDAADAPLAAAVAEAAEGAPESFLSLSELAARSGVDEALLDTLSAHGLLVARVHDGEPRYTDADVRAVCAGLELLGQGLPFDRLLALGRRHHETTSAIAEDAVAMFDEFVRQPLLSADLDPAERAERLVDAFGELLPAVTSLVEHHFRRVLLDTAQRHLEQVGDEAELEAADTAARELEHGWER